MPTAYTFRPTETRTFVLDEDEVLLHLMEYGGELSKKYMWQLEVNGDKSLPYHVEDSHSILRHNEWFVAWTLYLPILVPFKVTRANVHIKDRGKTWASSVRLQDT